MNGKCLIMKLTHVREFSMALQKWHCIGFNTGDYMKRCGDTLYKYEFQFMDNDYFISGCNYEKKKRR